MTGLNSSIFKGGRGYSLPAVSRFFSLQIARGYALYLRARGWCDIIRGVTWQTRIRSWCTKYSPTGPNNRFHIHARTRAYRHRGDESTQERKRDLDALPEIVKKETQRSSLKTGGEKKKRKREKRAIIFPELQHRLQEITINKAPTLK